ncbi:hypothetical protein MCOR25_009548 [Pyricularia grisea]|nr:hypothetical protein MCOR25_009548 [Pyricularia grisea]
MIWDKKRETLLKEGMEADAVRLDTEACIKEAMRFADEVAQFGNGWKPARARDLKFSASDLYYMGALLRTIPIESITDVYISKQMFLSAAEMGHGPAIVSNANLALNDLIRTGMKRLLEKSESTESWNIIDRFTKYAQHAKQDPNVLTVSGIIAIFRGDKAKATKCFLAAEMAGRTQAAARQGHGRDPPSAGTDSSTPVTSTPQKRLPRWDLEAQTLLGLGRLLEKSSQKDVALAAYSTAAYELDIAEACHRLGLLLSPNDPVEAEERKRLLTLAGMSGIDASYAPLAEMEAEKAAAARAAGSLEEAERHRIMAEQWFNLALHAAGADK